MKKVSELNDWIQLIGGACVLIGVVLVVVELQQSEEHTLNQIRSEQYDAWQMLDTLPIGEHLAPVLVKSMESPGELTMEDAIKLDGRMFAIMDQFDRVYDLAQRGLYDGNPDDVVIPNVEYYFGNRFAIAWWRERKEQFTPQLVAAIDSVILNISPDANLHYYKRILDNAGADWMAAGTEAGNE